MKKSVLGFIFVPLFSLLFSEITLAEVGMKCETRYTNAKDYRQFIQQVPLSKQASGAGANYTFDILETLEKFGRPDLILWTEGNYFHNLHRPEDSYFRVTHFLCQKASDSDVVKCLDRTSSGTVSAQKIPQSSGKVYRGMTILKTDAFLTALPSEKGTDVLMKYRLEHGHAYQKDLKNTREDIDKLKALYEPSLDITCSVRDDELGIEDIFSRQ